MAKKYPHGLGESNRTAFDENQNCEKRHHGETGEMREIFPLTGCGFPGTASLLVGTCVWIYPDLARSPPGSVFSQ